MFRPHIDGWLRRGCCAVLALAALGLCFLSSPLSAAMPSGDPVKIKVNVLFVLDSSGSMWARLDGQPKVESARKILDDALNGLPQDASIGLMTYGHRRKGDCSDIELIAPIGSKNANEIRDIANTLKPKGMTPLADSLLWAADAFRGLDGGKMIVLITDGGEECGGDPCAVARQLAASGTVVRVNVVGLIVSPKEREQLQCIAKEGGGRYFDVVDKVSLAQTADALQKEVETYSPPVVAPPVAAVVPAPVVEVPRPMPAPPPSEPVVDEVNLLLPSQGGVIVTSPNTRWNAIVSGNEHASLWTWAGQEAVFSFKDNRSARFSKFAIAIPATLPQNIHEFELLVSTDSPDGPYVSMGQFSTSNSLKPSLYQEFTFSKVTAKYFKFRVISNYGYPMQGWGNTQLFQIRLMGSLM